MSDPSDDDRFGPDWEDVDDEAVGPSAPVGRYAILVALIATLVAIVVTAVILVVVLT